jgi:hypothetical protein
MSALVQSTCLLSFNPLVCSGSDTHSFFRSLNMTFIGYHPCLLWFHTYVCSRSLHMSALVLHTYLLRFSTSLLQLIALVPQHVCSTVVPDKHGLLQFPHMVCSSSSPTCLLYIGRTSSRTKDYWDHLRVCNINVMQVENLRVLFSLPTNFWAHSDLSFANFLGVPVRKLQFRLF